MRFSMRLMIASWPRWKKVPVLVRTVLSTLLPVSESTTDDLTMEGRDCSTGRVWIGIASLLANEYKADPLEVTTTVMNALDCSTTRMEFELALVLITVPMNLKRQSRSTEALQVELGLFPRLENCSSAPHIMHGEGNVNACSFTGDQLIALYTSGV